MKPTVLSILLLFFSIYSYSQEDLTGLEILPQSIQDALEKSEREMQELPSHLEGIISSSVVEQSKIWNEAVLTVSFKGGSPYLHRLIATMANTWTDFGDITFDFGYNPIYQTFRTWKPGDNSHIRVGFQYSGNWSVVGNTSVDWEKVPKGTITLNLSNYDSGPLPKNWEATVLHEFGHALGFKHEHQSPGSECDFKWDKIYKELAKPPNKWSKEKVDHNLRKLQERGLTFTAYDSNSIMHYSLPTWMFESGKISECYTERNIELSKLDKKMMGEVYPRNKEDYIAQRKNIAKTYIKAAELNEQNVANDLFKEKADYFSKVREENNKYIVGIQGLRVSDKQYATFSDYVMDQGYSINLNSNYQQDRSWLAQKSVVLYYDRKNREKAKQLAAELTEQTGQKFEIGKGKGLAVFDPSKQFYIHMIPED